MRLYDQAKAIWRWRIASSHVWKMDVAWQCISEWLWKCHDRYVWWLFWARYNEAYVWQSVSCQGFGCTGEVCTNSRDEKGQCTVPKRLAKYKDGGSANNRILTLVKGTHPLIIGNSQSNQEIHKRVKHPKRGVWGFGYPCASLNQDTWGYSFTTPQKLGST